MIVTAPAKLNLCLYLGPRRSDGLHELRSLFCPLTLEDELDVTEGELDEVICPEVPAPDLAARALDGLRARGWVGSPLHIEVRKRIPIAAGLGGGSADAAAVLRLASDEIDGLGELARDLGADVPSQLAPGFALVGGAGEELVPLPPPASFGVVLMPGAEGLSTEEVFAEADRMALSRDAAELNDIAGRLESATRGGASPFDYADLLVNDLQPAALALRPEIEDSLAALREQGAAVALITGSGPTAFGLFQDSERASAAADALRERTGSAIATAPRTMP
jgi:4-diphosphocytidyl-2-C-methyl-D-erythritol kinase